MHGHTMVPVNRLQSAPLDDQWHVTIILVQQLSGPCAGLNVPTRFKTNTLKA